MKLSEFIKRLQEQLEYVGDLPVVMYDDHDGTYYLANGVGNPKLVHYVQDVGEIECVELG